VVGCTFTCPTISLVCLTSNDRVTRSWPRRTLLHHRGGCHSYGECHRSLRDQLGVRRAIGGHLTTSRSPLSSSTAKLSRQGREGLSMLCVRIPMLWFSITASGMQSPEGGRCGEAARWTMARWRRALLWRRTGCRELPLPLCGRTSQTPTRLRTCFSLPYQAPERTRSAPLRERQASIVMIHGEGETCLQY
jgi:hypothetical protein